MKYYLLITEPTGQPLQKLLRDGQNLIGRDRQRCHIFLDDDRVSREHMEIVVKGQELTVIHKGTNKTLLNGRELPVNEAKPLKLGDTLTIHPYQLDIIQGQDQEDVPKSLTSSRSISLTQISSRLQEPNPTQTRSLPFDDSLTISQTKNYPPLPNQQPDTSHYLHYLPDLYHTLSMHRFLALFEAIMLPIEWHIEHFQMYLDPHTTPIHFLPWLEAWWDLPIDQTWSEDKRRKLLAEMPHLVSQRGTHWAIQRVVEIYTTTSPEITLFEGVSKFSLRLPRVYQQRESSVRQLVDWIKPAHTQYELDFSG